MTYGDPRLPDRFWSKVSVQADGCWMWTGAEKAFGYGGYRSNGRTLRVHRVAYEALVGPVPDGLVIDHECHTVDCEFSGPACPHRRCVNPGHLQAITQSANQLRGKNSVRPSHCAHGHELSGPNLYVDPKRGWAGCRLCRHANTRKYRARVKGVAA